jgi:hypothetical protein
VANAQDHAIRMTKRVARGAKIESIEQIAQELRAQRIGRRSMSTQAIEVRRSGWLTVAAIVMFSVCFVRVISGINYLGHGSQISDLSHSVFGNNLWVWGVWDLILAGLALVAGLSLLVGGGFGRVVGYIWAIWVIVQSFLVIGLAPWFSIAMIALAMFVIYGLSISSDLGEER